ncbi:MAG TPA: hypothetical protein VIC87_02525, partial [Vicinamibacteria bacterium]
MRPRAVFPRGLLLALFCAALPARVAAEGEHPRLLLDDRTVDHLRASLATTHRGLWDRYRQDL